MALVEIRDVHKSFQRDTQRIDVFTGITLDVDEGGFLALMGPSGSGKSTLLNLIAGLDRPTKGTVRVAGAEVSTMTPGQLASWRARHIGFVFQQFNLLPVLTAYQNVELPLLLTKLSKRERDERVKLALSVVLLDEPTGQLDAKSSQEVLALLRRLNDEFRKTIVIVTHDAHAAERAKTVLHLEKGDLIRGTSVPGLRSG